MGETFQLSISVFEIVSAFVEKVDKTEIRSSTLHRCPSDRSWLNSAMADSSFHEVEGVKDGSCAGRVG
jgi:hypothetical protein